MDFNNVIGQHEMISRLCGLADENRLAIMLSLQQKEKCACYLLEELNISQSTLSHHMKLLCDSGLVDYRKDGKWMHYSLSEEGMVAFREMIDGYIRIDK